MKAIKQTIVKKANTAELTKSIFIPSFKSRPITLIGIPNLIKVIDNFSEARGITLPRKKPIIRKGTISTNNL